MTAPLSRWRKARRAGCREREWRKAPRSPGRALRLGAPRDEVVEFQVPQAEQPQLVLGPEDDGGVIAGRLGGRRLRRGPDTDGLVEGRAAGQQPVRQVHALVAA